MENKYAVWSGRLGSVIKLCDDMTTAVELANSCSYANYGMWNYWVTFNGVEVYTTI